MTVLGVAQEFCTCTAKDNYTLLPGSSLWVCAFCDLPTAAHYLGEAARNPATPRTTRRATSTRGTARRPG